MARFMFEMLSLLATARFRAQLFLSRRQYILQRRLLSVIIWSWILFTFYFELENIALFISEIIFFVEDESSISIRAKPNHVMKGKKETFDIFIKVDLCFLIDISIIIARKKIQINKINISFWLTTAVIMYILTHTHIQCWSTKNTARSINTFSFSSFNLIHWALCLYHFNAIEFK